MATPPSNLDVWVLAGQSNMEGCGPLQGALPADAGVWAFSTAGAWEPAVDPLHKLWESYAPVHQNFMRPGLGPQDKELSNEEIAKRTAATRLGGTGLGIAFANEWQKFSGNPTGLIAAAHGGTSLEQWNPAHKSQGLNSLYGAMLDRIERAGGNLKGILWYQGESDCNPNDAATYAERFDTWVAAARADTGRPDLPVYVVQLSRFVLGEEPADAGEFWNVVREAQRTLPDRTPNTDVVAAIDLDLSDSIHVGTPGLTRLGRRLARHAIAAETGGHGGPRLTGVRATKGHFDPDYIRLEFAGVTGGWNPVQHISGFTILTRAGAVHPILRVVNAFRAADDPTAIHLLLNTKVDGDTAVAYGLGFNPYANAVDEADIALLTFAPVVVEPLG